MVTISKWNFDFWQLLKLINDWSWKLESYVTWSGDDSFTLFISDIQKSVYWSKRIIIMHNLSVHGGSLLHLKDNNIFLFWFANCKDKKNDISWPFLPVTYLQDIIKKKDQDIIKKKKNWHFVQVCLYLIYTQGQGGMNLLLSLLYPIAKWLMKESLGK